MERQSQKIYCVCFLIMLKHMVKINLISKFVMLKKIFRCKLGIIPGTNVGNCRIEFRPSVTKKQLYILVLFGNGVLMSFWGWTNQICNAWCEYLIHWYALILVLIIIIII